MQLTMILLSLPGPSSRPRPSSHPSFLIRRLGAVLAYHYGQDHPSLVTISFLWTLPPLTALARPILAMVLHPRVSWLALTDRDHYKSGRPSLAMMTCRPFRHLRHSPGPSFRWSCISESPRSPLRRPSVLCGDSLPLLGYTPSRTWPWCSYTSRLTCLFTCFLRCKIPCSPAILITPRLFQWPGP
ncbi:hypothetical protein FPV67DRAFT_1069341 [Lyophyllum atratum]|nr:hypothetical protein FPV67DRAFT_1069341 [Lyophyllum atratum]